MARLTQIDDDKAANSALASEPQETPDVPGTRSSSARAKPKTSTPKTPTKTKTARSKGTSTSDTPDTSAHAAPLAQAKNDPFETFLIVSFVGFQLAFQTEMLAPLFNTLPLTRWSRWVGVFGVVVVAALLPGPNAMRILLLLAAISCDISVTHGRRIGSKLGQLLGPEWGPAAASAVLGFGSLVAAARLAVGVRSPGAALLHSVFVTGTLWTGEKLGRTIIQFVLSPSADSDSYTLLLAALFTLFAIVAHVPDEVKGRSGVYFARTQIALASLPLLGVASYKLYCRPSAPFSTPEVDILFSQKSNSGRIVVGQSQAPNGFTYRYLRADHSILGGQWMMKAPGSDKLEYSDSIFAAFPHQEVLLLAERGNVSASLRPAKGESALIIGLGVGIAARQFIRRGLLVDVVEYDEVVYDAAAEFFSYGIRRPRSKSIMDGAKYVQRAAEARRNNPDTPRWNYVVQDCFTAGSLPVELFTRDFWNDIQDVVTEDGVVVMNFAGIMDSKASRKVIRTLLSVLPQCRAFSDAPLQHRDKPCNVVFVCSPTHDPLLTFRAPTNDDIDHSHLRQGVYTTFLQREVPIDTLLLPGDWEDKDMILRSGAKLEYWNDAKETWYPIQDSEFTLQFRADGSHERRAVDRVLEPRTVDRVPDPHEPLWPLDAVLTWLRAEG